MNDPRVWRSALDTDPMNYEQGSEFFESVLSGSDRVHCLACEDGEPGRSLDQGDRVRPGRDRPVARRGTGLLVRTRLSRTGVWLRRRRPTIRYAFEDRNLRRVSARCGCFNDASIGPLESLGFEHEGTLREATWFRGAYHDMLWYGLLREEWRTGS